MTDNIVKFPNRELHIEFTPEEEIRYDEIVSGLQSAAFMMMDGMHKNTDATWDHVVDAMINATIMCGLEAGLTLEDMQELFHNIYIEKIEYDA